MSLLRFVFWIFSWCISHDAIFVGENPQTSAAWRTSPIQQILDHELTWIVDFPECAHGLKDPQTGLPMRKMTRIATNSECVAHALDRPCKRLRHQRVEGATSVWSPQHNRYVGARRSEFCGDYTKQMATTIVAAVETQLDMDGYTTCPIVTYVS